MRGLLVTLVACERGRYIINMLFPPIDKDIKTHSYSNDFFEKVRHFVPHFLQGALYYQYAISTYFKITLLNSHPYPSGIAY